MIETELKITLDAAGVARLRRSPVLTELRIEPRRTERLASVYYDTTDHALAAAGVSLRLRRVGRAWVQTVKRRVEGAGSGGLFANREDERPAPGGRLALDGPDADGALAAVAAAAREAPLVPVFETRVERIVERLRLAGGEVELALDRGAIHAGEAQAPICEAELELKGGEVAALFDLARRLFPTGPVRFATANKATRGYRLAGGGVADVPAAPRKAGTVEIDGEASVEAVACAVFRDCLAQIGANIEVVADTTATEGPHQLRIGLRRLRTACLLFGATLGKEALAPFADQAKQLGSVVGRLRDADVLIEVLADAAGGGLDDEAQRALAAALAARRDVVREEVRRGLAGPEATGFLFDLAGFIEGRGWLAPSDHSQTARLATSISEVAPGILDHRFDKVLKRGRRIRKLDPEGLHALRKQLKKLRYAVEMLGPIYKARKLEGFLGSLKHLQDGFGALNDAAMGEAALSGPEAPGSDDPAAQRAIGWTLGTLASRAQDERKGLFARWDELAAAKPFWR